MTDECLGQADAAVWVEESQSKRANLALVTYYILYTHQNSD